MPALKESSQYVATDPLDRIECALTVLVRRAQRISWQRPGEQQSLERAAYAILGRLYDEGPSRLSALAAVFGLDLSTVSRQVQALRSAGLVTRTVDPSDRRASLLDLTAEGRDELLRVRRLRRAVVHELLAEWPEQDQSTFAELLERFNDEFATRSSVAGVAVPDVPATGTWRAETEPEGE